MISLERVSRIYQVGDQQVRALDEATLSINAGEYVAIMGPSGSGKSTLLHILGLLDQPTSGSYRLDGEDVTGLSDTQQAAIRSKKLGFVFQFFHLVPYLTATENVELPMILASVPAAERSRRSAAALERMGLSDRRDHRPEQLSGGQRQRVAIARATVMQPSVILADEPTGNLDRNSGHEVVDVLEGLHGEGLTLIVVTHDPELGDRASRRIRMIDGRASEDRGA